MGGTLLPPMVERTVVEKSAREVSHHGLRLDEEQERRCEGNWLAKETGRERKKEGWGGYPSVQTPT